MRTIFLYLVKRICYIQIIVGDMINKKIMHFNRIVSIFQS